MPISNDQIRQLLETKNDAGQQTFTHQQIFNKVKSNSEFSTRMLEAERVGVTHEQILNNLAYGSANGRLEQPEVEDGIQDFLQPTKPGILQNRGEALFTGIEERPMETLPEKVRAVPEVALQVTGQTVGGIFDFIGESLVSGARLLSKAIPDEIEAPITDAIKNTFKSISETPIGQIGLDALSSGVNAFQKFKESNPRVASDIEALGNIVLALPFERAVVGGFKGVTGGAAGGAAKITEARLGKQITKEAIGVTKPVLSETEKQAALEVGRGARKLSRGIMETQAIY